MSQPDIEQAQYEQWQKMNEYWTPERMANATPDGLAPQRPEVAPETVGKFTTTVVTDPRKIPYCRAGKLFYQKNGIDHVGSASAIHPTGILTAAHCVFDRDSKSYATSIWFVPAYQGTARPFGSWAVWGTPVVPDQWRASNNHGWDFGFCLLGYGGLDGRTTVGQAVGHFGLIVERSDVKEWIALGYPDATVVEGGFDGSQMWSCRGDYLGPKELDEIGKAGNLVSGASGGPWVIPNTDYVNGVHSYSNLAYPNVNFSPFFGKDVLALYSKAFHGTLTHGNDTTVPGGSPQQPQEVVSP